MSINLNSPKNSIDLAMDRRYEEIEAYRVRNQNRRQLMWAVDMTYFSVPSFIFQGKTIEKGNAEMLVLGDTRTGKTSTIRAMMNLYGVGDFIQGEAVSRAGLLGGVDESGSGGRFIKAGRLASNHGELVIIDEANEMDKALIGQLSGMRSDGFFDLVMIIGERIPCKIRMIWLANTRESKTILDYAYGCQAVMDMIGKAEDVARFDLVICLSENDVDYESLSKPFEEPSMERRFVPEGEGFSERERNLILCAWSRKAKNCVINRDTEERVLQWADFFAERYDDSIPLMIRTESRNKIAKLACSTAALTCSYTGVSTGDPDQINLNVTPEHVDSACRRLRELYRGPSIKYEQWSAVKKRSENMHRSGLKDNLRKLKEMHSIDIALDSPDEMTTTEVAALFGEEKGSAASALIRDLKASGCIRKHGRYLAWTPEMLKLIEAEAEESGFFAGQEFSIVEDDDDSLGA
jgi:hypothetical protein